jgi:hypothetical protein
MCMFGLPDAEGQRDVYKKQVEDLRRSLAAAHHASTLLEQAQAEGMHKDQQVSQLQRKVEELTGQRSSHVQVSYLPFAITNLVV